MVDETTPLSSDVIDQRRADWERYRAECFIRCGVTPFWVWSAAHDFEFRISGLHLLDIPGASVDVGTHAIALTAFEQHFVVPIVRMTAESLHLLQTLACESLSQRQAELRAAQLEAERVLRDKVNQRFLYKAAPGSPGAAVQ